MELTLLNSIHAVDTAAWNRLWAQAQTHPNYPFVQHGFLAALEDSGSVCADSGWQPRHLVGHRNGELVLAMPLYLKSHSWGEYVFDWSWADAYQRHGLKYYPKLVNAIPFTPATGPRLMATDPSLTPIALSWLHQHCQTQGISGLHCLFTEETLASTLAQAGQLTRLGCQFHWHNRSYTGFEGFLAEFASRKRKNLRKERQQVDAAGVTLTRLTGAEIQTEDWDAFYRFYHHTYLKRSGSGGYLNRAFFEQLAACLSEQLLMVMAWQQGERIAAALCLFDEHCLYGRYWGCRREIPGLHFEACYYQGIEFAIERGLSRFDPGAQGEHKIQRGFEPILTRSSHWLTQPGFQQAVADFLQQETPAILDYQQQATELLPFRQG